jgi:hypothetical protein
MRDKGITGIGNVISHSIDSNLTFIKEHIKVYSDDPFYKHTLFNNLGLPLESRFRSYGWETVDDYNHILDWNRITADLFVRYGTTRCTIKWNRKFADIIGGEPGENDSYGVAQQYRGIKL